MPSLVMKSKFLAVMLSKFESQLPYVRTLFEIWLHQYATRERQWLRDELILTIGQMATVEILPEYETDRAQLITLAKSFFNKISQPEKRVIECPARFRLAFQKRRGRF